MTENDLNVLMDWIQLGGVLNYDNGLFIETDNDYINECFNKSEYKTLKTFISAMTIEALNKINMPEQIIKIIMKCDSENMNKVYKWIEEVEKEIKK